MTPVHHALKYVEITVLDMDAAQHFYGTAFGWRFTDYAPAYVKLSDRAVEIQRGPAAGASLGGG
jgi:uncharacterized protein